MIHEIGISNRHVFVVIRCDLFQTEPSSIFDCKRAPSIDSPLLKSKRALSIERALLQLKPDNGSG